MKYKFKTPPYKHQLTALEKSWNRETYAYFMEMGTGKTKVLIDNMAMLYDKGKINGALIIAPKGVVGTWYTQELPAHLPTHIENVSVLWKANITKSQSHKLGNLFKTDERGKLKTKKSLFGIFNDTFLKSNNQQKPTDQALNYEFFLLGNEPITWRFFYFVIFACHNMVTFSM